MQVKLVEQLSFDGRFYTLTKKEAIGKHHCSPTGVVLQQMHDQRQKKVSSFAGLVLSGKVVFYTILFHTTERRIGDDNIYPISGAVVLERAAEGVVVTDVGGDINTVQHHVGQGKHVRERFFFHPMNTLLQNEQVVRVVYLLLEMLNGIGEKAASTTCRIEHGFTQLRIENFNHKLCHRTRSIVFTCVTGRLQIGQNFFVDVIEEVTVA